MELTQKAKPVIIISLHEIAQIHNQLQRNISSLAKDKEDPLRIILNDLGDPPKISSEDDREIQLTLTNRFKQNMEGISLFFLFKINYFFRGNFCKCQFIYRNKRTYNFSFSFYSYHGRTTR